jgi:probable HAF family extracellular repeat protein
VRFPNSPTTSIPGPFGVAPVAPFLWEKGRMRNLGTLGGTFGGANAINSGGQVVGSSSLAENPFACLTGEAGCHPFIWQHGKLEDLGTLGGTFANGEWLNDVGEVIGFSRTTGDESIHAFFWKPDCRYHGRDQLTPLRQRRSGSHAQLRRRRD